MFKTLALTPAFIGLAFAANDWSKACTNNACSYESGDGVTTAWSAIDIEASPSTLSDITTAAGWNIAGCSSSWATGEAKIQLSCSGTAQQVALCDHLFDGGAANKVVRLPQDCGVGPFARVVSTTEVATNQFDVTLDYDFSKIPNDESRSLSFTVSSSNVQDSVAVGSALRTRHAQPQRRYPVALAPRFDIGDTVNLPPIDFSRSFTLLNQTFDCPAADGGVDAAAGLSIGAHVAVKVHSAFGVSVKGSVLPFPKVDSFQLTGTVTGAASALFDVKASVTGTFSTGDIQLFEVGLPGLNFPGIVNVGPRFVVNTRLDSALELQANVRAGATYKFPEVQLVFPQSEGKSIAHVKPVPDALKLSLEPGVSADGSVEAHLIPGLEFGFDVLGGLASANVFLRVDGSAKLGVAAQASAVITPGSPVAGSAGGCVNLDAGIAVVAGAEGSIPGIFDDEVSFDIFRRDFALFERCFGQGAQRRAVPAYAASEKMRRAMVRAVSAPETALTKRQLACPSPGSGGLLDNVLNLVRQ